MKNREAIRAILLVSMVLFLMVPLGIYAQEVPRMTKEELKAMIDNPELVIVDVNYPMKRSILGTLLIRGWMLLGDVIRDMDEVFRPFNLDYTDNEVGGLGTIHLYVAEKP